MQPAEAVPGEMLNLGPQPPEIEGNPGRGGNAALTLLDEQATGLDERARRHLWDLAGEFNETGSIIVLIAHCVGVAEQLYDREGMDIFRWR